MFIPESEFFQSQILDPGVNKTPDPILYSIKNEVDHFEEKLAKTIADFLSKGQI